MQVEKERERLRLEEEIARVRLEAQDDRTLVVLRVHEIARDTLSDPEPREEVATS